MLNSKEVSEKIKLIRGRLNMSQDRFGSRLGVSGKTISAYECGQCMPTLKILERMSEVYNVTFISTTPTKKTDLNLKIERLKDLVTEIESFILH